MSTAVKPLHPYYFRILELCKNRIDDKFDKHGNSWKENKFRSYWNTQLEKTLNEAIATDGLPRMYHLIDLVNFAFFIISNHMDADDAEIRRLQMASKRG